MTDALQQYYKLLKPKPKSLEQAHEEILQLYCENELLKLENVYLKSKEARKRGRLPKIKGLGHVEIFSDLFKPKPKKKLGRKPKHTDNEKECIINNIESVKDEIESKTGKRPNDKTIINMIAKVKFEGLAGWRIKKLASKFHQQLKTMRDDTNIRQRNFKKAENTAK